MVLGFVLNIAIIKLVVLCILFISAIWHKSSCLRIGLFTNFWGDGRIWTVGAGRIWTVACIQFLAMFPSKSFRKQTLGSQTKQKSHKMTNRIIGNVLKCFELLLHMLNKCTRNRNLGKSRSTCHQVNFGQPGKAEKIRDD